MALGTMEETTKQNVFVSVSSPSLMKDASPFTCVELNGADITFYDVLRSLLTANLDRYTEEKRSALLNLPPKSISIAVLKSDPPDDRILVKLATVVRDTPVFGRDPHIFI